MSLPERYRQLREEGNLPTQAWARLKSEYTEQFKLSQRTPSGDAAQSWKSASGKAFEDIVWQEFTSQCQGLQDLFWAERLRGRGIRFCFTALDNDGVLTRAAGTGDLIPIAQPKFTKTSMPDNPLLKVPPASRGNRTHAPHAVPLAKRGEP
jgi:hypothetical protein